MGKQPGEKSTSQALRKLLEQINDLTEDIHTTMDNLESRPRLRPQCYRLPATDTNPVWVCVCVCVCVSVSILSP